VIFETLDRRSLRAAGCVTLVPATLAVTAALLLEEPTRELQVAQAGGVPVIVRVSPGYEQGTVDHVPGFMNTQPVPPYGGGSINS